MDTRLTEEQRELDAAVACVTADCGPAAIGDLDDQARRVRLDEGIGAIGACQLRPGSRAEPHASGVECALVTQTPTRRLARRVAIVTVGVDRGFRRLAYAGDGFAQNVRGSTAQNQKNIIATRILDLPPS